MININKLICEAIGNVNVIHGKIHDYTLLEYDYESDMWRSIATVQATELDEGIQKLNDEYEYSLETNGESYEEFAYSAQLWSAFDHPDESDKVIIQSYPEKIKAHVAVSQFLTKMRNKRITGNDW